MKLFFHTPVVNTVKKKFFLFFYFPLLPNLIQEARIIYDCRKQPSMPSSSSFIRHLSLSLVPLLVMLSIMCCTLIVTVEFTKWSCQTQFTPHIQQRITIIFVSWLYIKNIIRNVMVISNIMTACCAISMFKNIRLLLLCEYIWNSVIIDVMYLQTLQHALSYKTVILYTYLL